ncbi:uncharacterized protein LOC117647868 [Thrips palmi]|uniref:Uncharacterized protein LOC117647868 n=1 Tax=Thrips palmi TaxID=161013 RepID=A0A6P8Z6B3_THRPL|nr:uncharacterized protein LOC117647868 [Thrips palmi]
MSLVLVVKSSTAPVVPRSGLASVSESVGGSVSSRSVSSVGSMVVSCVASASPQALDLTVRPVQAGSPRRSPRIAAKAASPRGSPRGGKRPSGEPLDLRVTRKKLYEDPCVRRPTRPAPLGRAPSRRPGPFYGQGKRRPGSWGLLRTPSP